MKVRFAPTGSHTTSRHGCSLSPACAASSLRATAFNIFVFMEISSLASYILVAGGPDRRVLPAVFKYLIMGTIGATFYLIGIGLIYMMTGTLNLHDMELRISGVADQRPILAAAGFITVGLALKAAVFPLHVWLPNAYTWAPHVTTAFLAACATKVSLYVLLRFDFFVFQGNLTGHAFQFAAYLMPLAVLGILVGSAVAMFEKNVKRLFAFSSVAQIGYIMLGASFISLTGLTAGIVHIFNHALAKGAVFLALAAFAMVAPSLRLEDLAGIGKRMPWTFAAFVVSGPQPHRHTRDGGLHQQVVPDQRRDRAGAIRTGARRSDTRQLTDGRGLCLARG